MKRVRLFISSPGDVVAERSSALAVVERLHAEFSETLLLEPVISAQEVQQDEVALPGEEVSPADCEIYITIIGDHLAAPTETTAPDPESPLISRTEREFTTALSGAKSQGFPELLVYRKSFAPSSTEPLSAREVSAFFDKWFLSAEDQTAVGAYHSFAETEQFTDLFTLHLRKLLRRFLPRPNNLPEPTSSFVGRVELIREVSSLLKQSDVRLVSLVGAGGTGKSRLGLHLARQLLPEFKDGVFLVTLASLRQADLVPGTIATTLDIMQNDNRPVIETVVDALQNKEMLLLIDNLEQVQAAATHIDALVSACSGVKILLTGREALRINGARIVKVPPFALPNPKKASFNEIADSESVQLFAARARSVCEDFQLSEDNAWDVLQVCHRLDGLPLAIELATSRLRTMDTASLLKSMEKRFAVLTDGADDLLDHQRSLQELISWSYELLSEDEQRLWRRMAIFTGGFAMEAAEQVCDPEDEFIVDIEVEGLVDKSLANLGFHALEGGEEEARVTMLDTLREYALQKLDEVGEYEQLRDRYCEWVTELAESSFEELRGAGSDARIALLEMEQVNLQAAIDHCREGSTPDWNRALRIGGGVWFYWFERGILSTSRELFEHALQDLPGVDPGVRALALRALGSIARFQNDLDIAERACNEALEIFTRLGDEPGQANVLGELGAIAQRQGVMDKAATSLDRALQLFDGVPDDLHGLSFASAARGVINHLDGDLAGARAFYEAALAAGSRSGDSDSIASALVNLGEVAEAEADYEQAYEHYSQSLALFARRGKKVAIAYCAEVIAGLSSKHRNKPSDAALFLGFADALRKETESPIEPFNAGRLQEDIEFTQRAMTPVTFQASWNAGASLEIDEFLLLVKDIEQSNPEIAPAETSSSAGAVAAG